MTHATDGHAAGARKALRQRLISERERFGACDGAAQAGAALSRSLNGLLHELEPDCLGVYWPHRSEFNAVAGLAADAALANVPLALPFARRMPAAMHYRVWDGLPPALRDDCGIATSDGAMVIPDVVLVPCVGFTRDGYRLGYGGGYFDRWLALHSGVTAIGVAWAASEIAAGAFEPQPHDRPLTIIVTEHGVV